MIFAAVTTVPARWGIIRAAWNLGTKVALSERDISDGKGVSLQGEFAGLFVASGGPRDAAMFDYVDNKPPYICFFSPGAFQIAEILLRQYGAIDKEQ